MDEDNKNQPVQAGDELAVEYANNVFFAATVWDLKLLFGELSPIKQAVDWHTSITLPWAAAKIMAYYLDINIAAHEASAGPILVPKSMLPPEPPPISEPDKDKAAIQSLVEYIKERRQKFLESQK